METNKPNHLSAAIAVLTEQAREIMSGSFKNVDRIFSLTDKRKHSPEIAELAESFGLMAVKVEAREYALEQTIAELREKKAALEESNRIRTQLASIFISVVLLIAFYTFVLGFLNSGFIASHEFLKDIKGYLSRGLELVTLLIVIRIVVASRLPLKDFGITLEGWKRSSLEALALSVPVIGLLFLFKGVANVYYPGLFREAQWVNLGYFDFSYIFYLGVAPLQEFITRGTVQSTLTRLFSGRHRGLMAILVTSFLFGSLHVYSSLNLAVVALLTSWLWGWMYNRQQTLVGVSISHFLIGDMAGLMGYWNFF
ncbi:MAG: type II CAAX endopeptidase family protein [Deltaproteobacteria bacterium]|nr:type II CAAX endopeptidase family protein [Deltaproteobacteria bacterium]